MTDCIIVGGGLLGMLSARELKKSGVDVLLLDKGELGQESSWAGGGILSPLHPWRYPDEVNQLAHIGHQIYPQIARELYSESGIDPQYIRSGLLVLNNRSESERNEQADALAWAEKWSMNLSLLDDSAAIQSVAPGIAKSFEQGMWLPDIGQMRNPRLVQAAKGSLQSLGVEYREHVGVESLNIAKGRVTGVVANGETLHAKQVLIAGGAWSAELLRGCTDVPDITPVKGQMILFKGPVGLLKSIVLVENRYLIPRKDGRVLCGSSIEHSGFDKSTSQDIKQALLDSAIEIFPELAQLQIEHHWAGLRPGSPEGVPFVGRHKNVEGLYVNAGHYRNGVILGIASCQRVAAEIMADFH